MTRVYLGDICDFINGGAWSDKEYVEDGIPVLKVTNCKTDSFSLEDIDYLPLSAANTYAQHRLCLHDVVIATVGSHPTLEKSAAGRAVIINDSVQGFYLNQNAVCLRSKSETVLNQRYLGYLARSFEFRNCIQMHGRGAANQMRIAIGSIKQFEFQLPDIHTQRRIADILSAYDDLIENNQKQIKLLEEAAQRLYREWFVELRFPGHETTPVVDGVPEGWERTLMGSVVEVRYGKDHKAVGDGVIPVYGSGGLMRKCCRSLYTGESVLIPRKGSLNNIMYVNEEFWTVDTMFYTHMKCEHLALFVYFFVKSFDMYSMNIGAAVPSMTTNTLDALEMVLPTESILKEFDGQVQQLYRKIHILKQQIETAQEARDRLLPKLMSGEVEV